LGGYKQVADKLLKKKETGGQKKKSSKGKTNSHAYKLHTEAKTQ